MIGNASDPLLGWTTTTEGKPFNWRQVRNWKGAVDATQLDADGLKDYGKLCSWTLAKAHAQQREQDHTAVVQAITWPRLPQFLGGRGAAGGIATINSVGNIGGFMAPVGWADCCCCQMAIRWPWAAWQQSC